MVTVISIGIEEYFNKSLSSIECAYKDAKLVYDVFKEKLGENFSVYNSICMKNIYINQFLELLRSIKNSLDKDDILILYFSGHGSDKGVGNLYLNFRDEAINIDIIRNLLSEEKFKIILVLDCCYSGMSLNLANVNHEIAQGNISVIAATESYETANYESEGSKFTKYFCKSIRTLADNTQDISINNIHKQMNQFKQKCLTKIMAGKEDIILSEGRRLTNNEYDKIIGKIISGCETATKQMMIYSLENYPSIIRLKIIDKIREDMKTEGDWLVRRAVGSILSNCMNQDEERKNIIENYLNEMSWMSKCIAIIAIRHEVIQYKNQIIDIITDSKNVMDLVWLAHLYFTDSPISDIEVSLKSNLMKSEWGQLEIFIRYMDKMDIKELYKRIESISEKPELLNKIKYEITLNEDLAQYRDLFLNIGETKALQNQLTTFLYKSPERLRTKQGQKGKWIFSVLFGNWRGHLQNSLKEYLDNCEEEVIKQELIVAQGLPRYEHRMAIFEYFQENVSSNEMYIEEVVKWGIKDEHPWVRREAVKLLKKINGAKMDLEYNTKIDKIEYPGTLDYMIVLLSIRKFYDEKAQLMKGYTTNEKNAIKKYVSVY